MNKNSFEPGGLARMHYSAKSMALPNATTLLDGRIVILLKRWPDRGNDGFIMWRIIHGKSIVDVAECLLEPYG